MRFDQESKSIWEDHEGLGWQERKKRQGSKTGASVCLPSGLCALPSATAESKDGEYGVLCAQFPTAAYLMGSRSLLKYPRG